jgi:glycosyltransferase 2 family protein
MGKKTRIASILSQLVAAIRLLSSGPRGLFTALALSMITHAAAIGFFGVLTTAITGQEVAYSTIATIYPLGVLTLLVPISPAGLGVGHVAFDRLFAVVGLSGGANIFNVYLVGQIAPALLGVFPYLALKRRGELPSDAAGETTGA